VIFGHRMFEITAILSPKPSQSPAISSMPIHDFDYDEGIQFPPGDPRVHNIAPLDDRDREKLIYYALSKPP
jgi:hypothetical protein